MISLTRHGMQSTASGDLRETVAVVRDEMAPASVEKAIEGGGSKRLSRDQKTALVMLAKVAYASVHEVGGHRGLGFDEWRAEESVQACGRRISDAHNRDFSALKAHFLNLAGEAGRAFLHAMRSETEDLRVAMHKLEEACRESGVELGYAGKICRAQFKCDLKELKDPRKVWRLVFTVRNRKKPAGAGEREKGKEKSEVEGPQCERKYTVKAGAKARKWEAVEMSTEDEEDPF